MSWFSLDLDLVKTGFSLDFFFFLIHFGFVPELVLHGPSFDQLELHLCSLSANN